jgi:hypothetical protein
MTDRPGFRESGDDSGTEYEPDPGIGIPRWIKVVGIVVAVVVLLVAVVMLLIGGGGDGGHGPSRHG